MAKKNSPLHRVIDARRWDGELLLGRLFILFHAAFLDAGFLPAAADPSTGPIPEQVGAAASALSLRYLVPLPDLLAAVALRVCAHGRHVVFYVDTSISVSGAGGSDPRRRAGGSSRYSWACVDAVAAAPLLSGGLDATARALRNDPLVSVLWRDLAEGLSGRALAEICGGGALLGGTSFMSLPDDSQAEILARLGGEDLKRVSAACRDLRRLVRARDREFLKRICYDTLLGWRRSLRRRPMCGLLPWTTYEYDPPGLVLTRRYTMGIKLPIFDWMDGLLQPLAHDALELVLSATEYLDRLMRKEAEAEQLRTRAMAALASPWSSCGGREKRRRHHAGAINSPSARYTWKHR